MVCHKAHHVFVQKTLLLLAGVHQRFFTYTIYHPRYAYEKISRTLNDEGILSAAGSKWKPAAIAGILKNPIYMGVYAINKRGGAEGTRRMDRREWIYSEKQIPELVIIPKSAWEKAQEIR